MVRPFRFATLAFVIAKCGVLAFAQGTPNLTPYQPQGWSDKIVVSNHTGTHTDSSPLKTTDQIYVDWAVLNNGTASAPSGFQVSLYVDGLVKQSWTKSTPQDANFYSYVEDYPLGSLGPGTHSIRLVADSTGVLAESNETDNEYTKTISLTAPPNLTPFQPTGWSDKIFGCADRTQPARQVDLSPDPRGLRRPVLGWAGMGTDARSGDWQGRRDQFDGGTVSLSPASTTRSQQRSFPVLRARHQSAR